MRHIPIFLMVLVIVSGCGSQEPAKKEAVALDKVPENVMKIAKEKLPGVTFDRAMKKANGEYEILGKSKDGKIREIDISPSGEVTETDK